MSVTIWILIFLATFGAYLTSEDAHSRKKNKSLKNDFEIEGDFY